MTPENIAEGYGMSGMLKTKDFDPEFLQSVLEDFDKSISPLLKWIFIKRILTNPMLLFYCIKAAFTMPPSQWGSVYYKVIFSHHALTWDIRRGRL